MTYMPLNSFLSQVSNCAARLSSAAIQKAPPLTKGLVTAGVVTYGISSVIQAIGKVIALNSPSLVRKANPLLSLKDKVIIHLAVPIGASVGVGLICKVVSRTRYGKAHFVALALFTTLASALHTGINYLRASRFESNNLPEDPDDLPASGSELGSELGSEIVVEKPKEPTSADTAQPPFRAAPADIGRASTLPNEASKVPGVRDEIGAVAAQLVNKAIAAATQKVFSEVSSAIETFSENWDGLKVSLEKASAATIERQKAAKAKTPDLQQKREVCIACKSEADSAYLEQLPKVWGNLLEALPASLRYELPYAKIVSALTYPRIVRNLILEPMVITELSTTVAFLKSDTVSHNLRIALNTETINTYISKANQTGSATFARSPEGFLLGSQFLQILRASLLHRKLLQEISPEDILKAKRSVIAALKSTGASAEQLDEMLQQLPAGATNATVSVQESEASLVQMLNECNSSYGLDLKLIADEEVLSIPRLDAAFIFISSRSFVTFKEIFNLDRAKRLQLAKALEDLLEVRSNPNNGAQCNQLLEELSKIEQHASSDAWAQKVHELMIERLQRQVSVLT